MKTSHFSPLAIAMVFWAGCAAPESDPRAGRERVSYYDRNGDGRVDLEKHEFRGMADADWELRDDDHNGRYEKKVLFGIGVFESSVDLPVPTGVHIKKRS